MSKQDLTIYNDSELSNYVFNDEWLYKIRHTSLLIPTLEELFIYNDSQLNELKQDLTDDLEGL